jgi:hypothetical protein
MTGFFLPGLLGFGTGQGFQGIEQLEDALRMGGSRGFIVFGTPVMQSAVRRRDDHLTSRGVGDGARQGRGGFQHLVFLKGVGHGGGGGMAGGELRFDGGNDMMPIDRGAGLGRGGFASSCLLHFGEGGRLRVEGELGEGDSGGNGKRARVYGGDERGGATIAASVKQPSIAAGRNWREFSYSPRCRLQFL